MCSNVGTHCVGFSKLVIAFTINFTVCYFVILYT